jgi:hypothetical protein
MPLHKTYIALLNVHNDQLKGTQNSGNEEKFPTDTIKYATYKVRSMETGNFFYRVFIANTKIIILLLFNIAPF